MTNLNLYKFFCVVAEEKNISRASEKMFVSQPAVSFSIRELEKELGQKLFVRKSKGVELTPFGKVLYEKVKNLVNAFDEAENLSVRYKKLSEGIIRIGSCTSNVNQKVLKYLTEFALKYPNIKIVMERGTFSQLQTRLYNNDLDIIFVDENEKSKDFVCIKKFDVKYQLIGDSNYKNKYHENNINIKTFPFDDLMLPSVNNNSRITINNYFAKFDVELKPKYELDNYILLYDFVKNGLGIAFVNIEYYTPKVESGEVKVIYPDFSICARKIVCLINDECLNPALDKLVEIIKKEKD